MKNNQLQKKTSNQSTTVLARIIKSQEETKVLMKVRQNNEKKTCYVIKIQIETYFKITLINFNIP